MYAITVDYYTWNEEQNKQINVKVYLGCIYPPINIFVFDTDFNRNSYRFKTEKEAFEFIKKHNLKEGICYENISVEKIDKEPW